VGAACYVGTFVLENNFDYRLIFLIFVLPQLLAWAGDASSGRSGVARVALAGIYVALWSMLIDRAAQAWLGGPWIGFLISEAAEWTVFCTLLQLVLATAPEWLGQTAGRWFSVQMAAGEGPARNV
jgi:hypothetical protein